jgi:sugar lactone lactonase YvrE
MRKHPTLLPFILGAATLLVLTPAMGFAQLITTYAGGRIPTDGAQATTEGFGSIQSVISDRAGGFYFSATYQHRVYRVSSDGTLRIVAGTGFFGFSGDGGQARLATVNGPGGLALDGSGNLLIADTNNNRIRKVTIDGVITTVAGSAGVGFGGDGGPANAARLNSPHGIAVGAGGVLYIADTFNQRIRRVSAAGIISTIAGIGNFGFSGDGGPALNARFSSPRGVAVDANGNVVIADTFNHRVRRINADGTITTIAGNGSSNQPGDGSPATNFSLSTPSDIAVDASGNLLIATIDNNRIRKLTPAGFISTIVGSGNFGYSGDGGPALAARLAGPQAVAVDSSGNIFIADSNNYRVRKVTTGGVINTVAGNGTYSYAGDGGPAALSALNYPIGLARDSGGNLFVADYSNSRIRKITPGGVISSFVNNLTSPISVAVEPTSGNVFTADCDNRVYMATPAGGVANLFATGPWFFCSYYYNYTSSGYGGGVAASPSGNVYVADTYNSRIFRISNGTSILVAGTGQYGFAGDGGPATAARLGYPTGLALDTQGNLYIADAGNSRIRKVTPEGIISTVAGNGTYTYTGDGGPAIAAGFNTPSAVALDAGGNIFIADTYNNAIRKVTPEGIISTVAGNGVAGFSGDGGPAISAQLNAPLGLEVDASGNLFIADTNNNRIRRVGLVMTVPTLATLSTTIGGQGSTVNVTLSGTSFSNPLTINAGSGITVSNVTVVNEVSATATFTIASNATLGPHDVNVTTNLGTSGNVLFTVVAPYPDLSITSSHTGNLAAGFNATYLVSIANLGAAPTTGPTTLTDALPLGLNYVSGEGDGWSCSSAQQIVDCVNPNALPSGGTTTLNLTVAVGADAPAGFVHSPRVVAGGDLVIPNNTASDPTIVAVGAASLRFTPQNVLPGQQATVELTIPTAFPEDVSGTLVLGFLSDAINPGDDPAIQWETGGRTVTFTIPANTLQARFSSKPQPGPIGFQPGTVSGTLTINGTVQTGAVETPFSSVRTIPRQAPEIRNVQRVPMSGDSFAVALNLSSTAREVTQLTARFQLSQQVRLSCGAVPGCSVSGNSIVLDVKSMFDAWFVSDTLFGSTSRLNVPLLINRSLQGAITITLTNRFGTSNVVNVTLP